MVLYRANRDNIPFYKNGDVKTKVVWLKKLNLSGKEFDILASSDFDQENNQLRLVNKSNGDRECIALTIEAASGAIPEQVVISLTESINKLIADFNK